MFVIYENVPTTFSTIPSSKSTMINEKYDDLDNGDHDVDVDDDDDDDDEDEFCSLPQTMIVVLQQYAFERTRAILP